MTAIASALMAGHSVKSVLKYLSQNNPQLASQISTAINAGYTIDHVLKYLSKNEKKMEPLTNPKLSSNIFEQGQSRVHPSLINAGKLAGTAAAVGLGAYGLSRLAPQATHAISGQVLPAIPGIPPQSGQKGLPAPKIPGGPQGPIPTNPVQTPPNTQQQPMQTPQQQQPTQTPMTQPVPNLAVFKKYPGLESKIADLRNAGNDAISIAGYFQKFNPSQTKKLEAEAGEPFEQLVEKYIAHTPIQSKQQHPMQPNVEQAPMPEQEQTVPEQQTQKQSAPKELIISPQGKIETEVPQENAKPTKYKAKTATQIRSKEADTTPNQMESFKIMDDVVKKGAKFLMSGGSFVENLPAPKGVQLSTAEDVMRYISGMPEKYHLMDDEQKQEIFSTHTGLSPNVIWNTLSTIDPRIQKIRPPSPKGSKGGKSEMTGNDFRRMLAHSVYKLLSDPNADINHFETVIKSVDAADSFLEKSKKDHPEAMNALDNLSDEELNNLLAAIPESTIKAIR